MWQNGLTWLTGIALLVIVYYMQGAAGGLVEPGKLSRSVAITLAISSLLSNT